MDESSNKFENFLIIKKINFDLEGEEEYSLEDKSKFILPIDSHLITKEEYDKIFNTNTDTTEKNKKRSYGQMNTKNNNVNSSNVFNCEINNNGKKLKKTSNLALNPIDPKKKLNPNPNSIYSNWSIKKLEEEINKIEKNIEEFNPNNDEKKQKEIKKFEKLYDKWVKISQDAMYNILEMFPENQNYEKNTIKTLIEHFKIDKKLIKYDSEDECFQ